MTHLIDINVLVALAWSLSPGHKRVIEWADREAGFATSTAVQVAFMRVSMSPAFGATFGDASAVLESVLSRWQHRLIPDSISAADLPPVQGHKEIHDAHLIVLARQHGLKLATLDQALCLKPWAANVANYISEQSPSPA